MNPSQVGRHGRRKPYPPTNSLPHWASRWSSLPHWASRWSSPPHWASRWSSPPHWASRWSSPPHWASRWSSPPHWASRWSTLGVNDTHAQYMLQAEHLLHSHSTSDSANTLSGISRQWRWYQTWQESHSAITSPFCSGILHVQ